MKTTCFLFFLCTLTASILSASASFTPDEVANSYGPAEVDQLPEPKKQVAPDIPSKLKGVRALVRVGFLVDVKGEVVAPRISKSSNADFDEICLEAIKDWRFKPAKKDGEPVAIRLAVPFRFK